MAYPFKTIESKWQDFWQKDNTTAVEPNSSKPKYYVMDMFPYPSGVGLHMGHPMGYVATDIVSRFMRLSGYNVLHPMGFDAFGLPTERQAMKENIHPAIVTDRNITTFTRQLNMIGFDYDWSRSVNTTKPDYYKWTQWLFLKLYDSWFDTELQKARPIAELPIPSNITDPADMELYRDSKRLTYIASSPVNWCAELGTVLANEEVEEWKNKGYTVERKPMKQWMMRITAYAERLLKDLDLVQWPNSTVEMQRHWIGRSDGAEIDFQVAGHDHTIRVFSTRPDTLFGATYLVLAPEHPLVSYITTREHETSVQAYAASATLKSDLDRTELAKEKTGVFTGSYAINPASGEQIPIWTADYVLAHYGTGAIMAVPGHDQRDYEFAVAFGLPILRVVGANASDVGVFDHAYTDYGIGMNSSNAAVSLNGLDTATAKRTMIDWLEQQGLGTGTVQYRLRDWLFSRQRYWGEPIPILFFEDGTKRALTPDELPLMLPEVEEFKPSGTTESPLSKVEAWMNVTDPVTGKRGWYETNTMPQWAGSCWYYLRYINPNFSENFTDPFAEKYWMGDKGVDLYVGGGEHAVLHLLYARFWHKVLYDYNLVSSPEPFYRLVHQGMLQSEDGSKMSKSMGKSVSPDTIVEQYGADALRLHVMFLGPLEAGKPWNTSGLEGITRFLNRAWRLIADEDGKLLPAVQDIECTPEQDFVLYTTIQKTIDDVHALSFNTSIAQFMIFVNEFTSATVRPRKAMEMFLQCLAPFAPHIADELWHILGHTTSIHKSTFPTVDSSKLVQNTSTIIVQVNSKVRAKLEAPSTSTSAELEAIALADENVQKHLEGLAVRKMIVVPGKLVNIIAG